MSSVEAEKIIPATPTAAGVPKADLFAYLLTMHTPEAAEVLKNDLVAVEIANADVGKISRKNGEPATVHEVKIAIDLGSTGLSLDTQRAAIWHDVLEDTSLDIGALRRKTNPDIARIVKGVTKVKAGNISQEVDPEQTKQKQREQEERRTLARFLEVVRDDRRAAYVKIADNKNNTETISALPPDRRIKRAHISLNVYEPIAHGLGLRWFARVLGEENLAVTQPYFANFARDLIAVNSPDELHEQLAEIIRAWTQSEFFREFPLDFESVGIEIPSIYDIYRANPVVETLSPEAAYPFIRIIARNGLSQIGWYLFLQETYRTAARDHEDNPLVAFNNDQPLRLTIPVPYEGQNRFITITISRRDLEIMPVDLDIEDSPLNEDEQAIAQAKWQQLTDTYDLALSEKRRQQQISQQFTEIAGSGRLTFLDKDGVPYPLPQNSTLLDAGYRIAAFIGNHASSVLVRRGNAVYSLPLSSPVEDGDQVEFGGDTTLVLPSRYDLVTTRKARMDISTELKGKKHLEKVKRDAIDRGKKIVHWLFREQTGRPYQIHLDYGFYSKYGAANYFEEQYTDLNNFLMQLGYYSLPANPDSFPKWLQAQDDQPIVSDAFFFVRELNQYANSRSTIVVSLREDTRGVAEKVARILSSQGINILPFHGVSDPTSESNRASKVYATISEGQIPPIEFIKGILEHDFPTISDVVMIPGIPSL